MDLVGLVLVLAAIVLSVGLLASLIWAAVVTTWLAGVVMLAFSRLTRPTASADDEAKP